MQVIHFVDALYHLVCFWSGWYWLFLLSMCSASFRSSSKAGLVVTKSLSNCFSIKDFIFPSLMKLSLAGYEILVFKFVSLGCWILSTTLFWPVGFLPRVSLMGFPLWVTWPFSLAVFSIIYFILTLVNLVIMFLGVALLEEYLCGVLRISWIWMLACFLRLRKFSWIISWTVFSNLVSFFPSLLSTPIRCRFGLFM